MISSETRTVEWLSNHFADRQDPEIIEKMVMVFTLVESLKRAGLDFIFKGGTSLSLLTRSLDNCRLVISHLTQTFLKCFARGSNEIPLPVT